MPTIQKKNPTLPETIRKEFSKPAPKMPESFGATRRLSEYPSALLITRATVYIEKGWTRNLGKFNSAKVSVGVTIPVDPTPEELAAVNATIKIANEIVDAEMEIQIAEIETHVKSSD